jgi:hypothetical protein
MAWLLLITPALYRRVLKESEPWLEAFSLPLLIPLKAPWVLEPITNHFSANLASSVPRDQQGVVQEYSPVVHRLRLSA